MMMKKKYLKPTTEVIKLGKVQLLTGSSTGMGYGGPGGSGDIPEAPMFGLDDLLGIPSFPF
jgi:hypothetical protein